MLVLAVDTATPAVTAGVVRLEGDTPRTLATRITVNARAHAEVLTPHILECLAEAGFAPSDLDAVVVGCGPGPFTGLRVGMATAAAFGDALGIPVHGVCSLDAIAIEAALGRDLLVVTDARRREVYWARYSGGARVQGPEVNKPADLEPTPSQAIAGSAGHVDLFDLPVEPVETPSPSGLVAVAVAALRSGAEPAPLVPLYLRRPDAVAIADRKK
ncbi:tRNA threonylcarbamoyl adenosine modification protein YeaZ [Rhodococcus sp. PvR044]|uniref:tRNA (adenosine(37)-N6)-threonylcarbamoyltransferase complex dimerization subunit type 1 TsaB n=1 Tax=unclassified Rhodococcus (in: high G+C Gram-positive bacteria) TaxID=192944 RepID=UPI000BD92DF6|nr:MULTISPECIES: tRNA (adenosine(37)-N6)-threonylcarbamoyltransferase complex dimerization subunit type 1 TsaB [unclassified Rhodococcus (in: high G+C Gram-positive bacteria)]MBP1162834.1 tRNA threonylcarbamoyl adenosine modification protein YeaZ [Rhodococcus sp. PvR099]PTR44201.1 tRNA threonylcarbamoyl adenosine modification protein YeaZ [Rhodococcus sp. OK611]SNX89642.1 tRNA threonylcarbamoyl adenosine modification protein YeaZ [Rhodococcus sp. OK270]